MRTFDEEYGDGSILELAEELAVPELNVIECEDHFHEVMNTRFVNVVWTAPGRYAQVRFNFDDAEVWVYQDYVMAPEGEGLYAKTSLCFCEAAIKRGVARFDAPSLTPSSRAVLELSGWDFDEWGQASVEPAVLAEYGRAKA